ncbi:MAG TPA: tRNA (cytidine(34)-2'-O)-methyltransferase [Leptospiraceae bacterium]|nr:tRNA (cytidine(34)-2'-O)-methyltransferase [Leptospiraceae bacterium]HMZ57766.1 tRNA (cytidine(34)-2'-O)-methyltransferase [Leptospiraceae bacterium]HNF23661.1 tRNA (cytidine(34)-2'-O)-methyltransferase [Leptospiraceae bacterium]HNM04854.1 tRNA (cytidine(34)-2'-O)-methyltransferase [Leptospiraceae bacterium]
MLFQIALYRPEIPPNTGNIARLCVGLGVPLHIVGTPSFDLSEKAVRRAGLDYWEHLTLHKHESWEAFRDIIPKTSDIFLISKFGKIKYTDVNFPEGSCLLFGSETSGVPENIRMEIAPEKTLYIPMRPECRSLNLSNAVAAVAYETLRQLT